jgi:hypothetical protein
MTPVSEKTNAPASAWAWALLVASSAFALGAAVLLGLLPTG